MRGWFDSLSPAETVPLVPADGPYRYVRNSLYVASVVAISGQALMLSRAVLLIYAAAFLAITVFLVHWIEDPALAAASASNLRTTATRCPAGGPTSHAARPDIAPNPTTKTHRR